MSACPRGSWQSSRRTRSTSSEAAACSRRSSTVAPGISGHQEDRVLVGPAPPEVAAPAVVEHREPALAAGLGHDLQRLDRVAERLDRDVELVLVRVGPVALGLARDAAVADEVAHGLLDVL